MEQMILGRTGLQAGRLGFGALPIQRASMAEAVKVLQKAYASGVNFFDTARMYTDSEEKIGQALGHVRNNIFIATKTTAAAARDFFSDLETSLTRLKTDHVDLLQFHFARKVHRPGQESGLYEAMLEAKKQGKIRFIGLTAHALPVAREAAESGLYDTVQYPLSLLSNDAELELIEVCRKREVGLLAMKGLAGGVIRNIAAAFAFLHRFPGLLPLWGMARMEELDEFLGLIADPPAWGPELSQAAEEEKASLGEEFCRGCGYCAPCPADIEMLNVARIALMMRRMPWQLYITPEWQAKVSKADNCVHCGQCAARCPYGLQTDRLVEQHAAAYWRILREKGVEISA